MKFNPWNEIKKNFKRLLLYMFRWQLSTPILAPIMALLSWTNPWIAATVANLIGSLIFFWVDKFIFQSSVLSSQWEIKEEIQCHDCGKISRGYRLVKSDNYDKSKDKEPEFRCEQCSETKSQELKDKGVKI